MKKKCYEFIIFDWSGVISDNRRAVYESNIKMLAAYGKPLLTYEEWLNHAAANIVDFMASQGVRDEPEKLLSLYETSLNEVEESGVRPVMYAEAPIVLKHLRECGKKTAVLSSHPSHNLHCEALEYGLFCYFDLLEGGSRNKVRGIGAFCRRFQVPIESALYLGDTAYDIQSAKKAGVAAGGVATGYHPRKRLAGERPDYLFDSLLELKEII